MASSTYTEFESTLFRESILQAFCDGKSLALIRDAFLFEGLDLSYEDLEIVLRNSLVALREKAASKKRTGRPRTWKNDTERWRHHNELRKERRRAHTGN